MLSCPRICGDQPKRPVRWSCGDGTFQHDVGLIATSTILDPSKYPARRARGNVPQTNKRGVSPNHEKFSRDVLCSPHHRNNETHLAGSDCAAKKDALR